MKHEYSVYATYDSESGVWVAESPDVPGLVTESDTLDTLLAKLRVLVPELLEANGVQAEDVPIHLMSAR
jgi:predicted RNase H-like HicB family nuclease